MSIQSFLSPDSHPIPNKNAEVSNRFFVSLSWTSSNYFNECCLFEMLTCFMLSPQDVHSNKNIHQGEKAVCFLFVPKLKRIEYDWGQSCKNNLPNRCHDASCSDNGSETANQFILMEPE